MITFLRRWLIKDYDQLQNPRIRLNHGIVASWIGVFLNVILIGLKTAAAILMAASQNWIFSMALLGDAINNAGDLLSSLVSLIGFSSAKKPADQEHPFGHQRMEYIAALIVGMIILFAAFTLGRQSIEQLVNQQTVSYDLFAYIVFASSILIKCLQAYIFYGFGKAIDSLTLKGVGMDSLLDVTSSTVILIAAIITYFVNVSWLDGALGIAVSLFIAFSAIKMMKEASSLLLGESIPKAQQKEMMEAIIAIPGVLGAHDLIIHEYGHDHGYASVHIEVDASLSLLESHAIADQAEETISKWFPYEIVVHVDPKRSDEEYKSLEEKILHALHTHIKHASIHDLQIDGYQISFDLLLPHEDASPKEEDIQSWIKAEIGDHYSLRFQIDHPYDI